MNDRMHDARFHDRQNRVHPEGGPRSVPGLWKADPPAEPSRSDLLSRIVFLEGKLVTLPAIEQAKGALMITYGLSADAAFALLRFHSQQGNVKIRAIADQLTTLMRTSPTSSDAIARFERLLDQVASSLQAAPADPGRTADPLRHTASHTFPDISPDDNSQVTLRAVASAPPGITIAGNAPDHPLVYANDSFAETTGYAMADVLGRNCRFLQGAETDPKMINQLSRGLRSGKDVSVVMRNYRRDGEPFWNEVSISPIRDRTDQITHFIGTQIDITSTIERQKADATG